MLSLPRLERKQEKLFHTFQFEFTYFSFFLYSFGIETINTFIHSRVVPARKPYPIPDQSVDPFSDQNGAKTLPDGAAHTCMGYIREYPPGVRKIGASLASSSRRATLLPSNNVFFLSHARRDLSDYPYTDTPALIVTKF